MLKISFISLLIISCTINSICYSQNTNKRSELPFPRLGMWWLDAWNEPPEKIARYDLLLNEFENNNDKLQAVRQINPHIKVFRPISPTETAWYTWNTQTPEPLTKILPSSFFLLKIGSVLRSPISANDTVVPLKDISDSKGVSLFHTGQTIAIGRNESARIISINVKNKTLTVKRGFIRPASKHNLGEHVAEHFSFWPKTWVMNNTYHCPREIIPGFNKPMNWLEFFFIKLTNEITPYNEYINQKELRYDGIIIDRFEDYQSWLADWSWNPEDIFPIDLYHNNQPVPVEEFDASWRNGTDILLKLLRAQYPGLPIIRNNASTVRYALYDGQVYETGGWSSPSTSWWENLFIKINTDDNYFKVGPYMDWFKNNKTKTVLIEVYEDETMPDSNLKYKKPFSDPEFIPNYQRMRFSLTSTLLGDGFYSYEANTSSHGSGGLIWFDEYDNAGQGKGYLGYPTGEYKFLPEKLYMREFDHGIVLVNPNSNVVHITLDRKYRKIKGKQNPIINDGKETSRISLNGFDGIILLK